MIKLVPISLKLANEFVAVHHRHNKPVRGCKFTFAAQKNNELVGVLIAGRPVARMLDDGFTIEILRCCVIEGYPNVCSKLYGAARRIAGIMGYTRVITYTLASECGASLRAVAARSVAGVRPGGWNRVSRPCTPQPVDQLYKVRWEL